MALDIYPTTKNGYADQILRCSPNDYTTVKTEIVRNEVQICPTRIGNLNLKNILNKANALVRANYNNLQKGVHSTTKFLEMFFSNLLLDTHYD